jgi:hypothetical protein
MRHLVTTPRPMHNRDEVGTKISDDDLLAMVCRCGSAADVETICRYLGALLGTEVDEARVEARLQRLRLEGLLRTAQHPPGTMRFHLTQAGVDRLEALESEPSRPAID